MTDKYLLPCSCGRQLVIEPRQAGQTIPCSCGASIQAPTLLQMVALEPVPIPREPVVQSAGSSWGPRNQIRFLGVVLVIVALIGGIWLYAERPASRFDAIDPEQLRETAKSLPPLRTWQIWETMKQGLDRRIDLQYAAAVQRFRVWQLTVAVVAIVGAGLIAAGQGLRIRGQGRGLAPDP